jgi:glutamine cyclotransferase
MLFGKQLNKILSALVLTFIAISSCKKDNKAVYFLSPVEGASVLSGESITLKTDAEPGDFDSVRYFVDSKMVASRRDTQSVNFPTTGLPFGGRLLTAIIYRGRDSVEVTTNIQLLPSKAPIKYSYSVVNTFRHDTSSYTQGLEYHDGVLYESDGEYGQSSLRKVDYRSGNVLKKIDIPSQIFAEGITLVGNKIIMLTWQSKVGFVFDKDTFTKLGEFPYTVGNGQGWGLVFNGSQLLCTDGSNVIYQLNKDTYQQEGAIEVYDSKGPVNNLNELEFIDGKIYANIYQQDRIVIIDPKTGEVEAELNLSDLAPYADRLETGLVLNGIAWDAQSKRLFVTGKKWNKLYEIKLSKGN